jgi:hypothetical protein
MGVRRPPQRAAAIVPPHTHDGAGRTFYELDLSRQAVPDVRNDFSWAADGQVAVSSAARSNAGWRSGVKGSLACLPVFASI